LPADCAIQPDLYHVNAFGVPENSIDLLHYVTRYFVGDSDLKPVTKCPRCWAPKAYVDQRSDWRETLLSYLFVVPMKCHHCYHRFRSPWFATFGKRLDPLPKLRIAPETVGKSLAVAKGKSFADTADVTAEPAPLRRAA
jgi:hypothetical protein